MPRAAGLQGGRSWEVRPKERDWLLLDVDEVESSGGPVLVEAGEATPVSFLERDALALGFFVRVDLDLESSWRSSSMDSVSGSSRSLRFFAMANNGSAWDAARGRRSIVVGGQCQCLSCLV